MKIKNKLNIAFSLIILVILCSTIFYYINLNKTETKIDEVLEEKMMKINLISDMKLNLINQEINLKKFAATPSNENKSNLKEIALTLDENIIKLIETKKEKTKEFINQIDKSNQEYNTYLNEYITLIEQGKKEEATNLFDNELTVTSQQIVESSNGLYSFVQSEIERLQKEINDTIYYSMASLFFVLIIVLIITIVLYLVVDKTISKPLAKLMVLAETISKGDLTVEDMDFKSKDEIGQLSFIFNDMKKNISTLIKNVKSSAVCLTESSQNLSSSTQEVNAATEEIANQISKISSDVTNASFASKESATTMDETAYGVQNIAKSSQNLSEKSSETNELALNGQKIISDAKEQMTKINETTTFVNNVVNKLTSKIEEIETISKQITAITDQTNLLALNASIEAARAGEAGKGFAVVADEVKKLAEQSKQSANSIGLLTKEIYTDAQEVDDAIKDSLHSVELGVEVIQHAGESFDDILTSIISINNEIQEVSATSEQLSASAEQVSSAVTAIANNTVTTSDSLSNISKSMEEQTNVLYNLSNITVNLTDNALTLEEQVNKFKI